MVSPSRPGPRDGTKGDKVNLSNGFVSSISCPDSIILSPVRDGPPAPHFAFNNMRGARRFGDFAA
jgi:hypothetical protein